MVDGVVSVLMIAVDCGTEMHEIVADLLRLVAKEGEIPRSINFRAFDKLVFHQQP